MMKVLICDDEQLARDRLRRLLGELENVEILGESVNGHDAVVFCQQQRPDVILMDVRMPEMDGLEAARHLMQMDEPPALIFCTAYDEHALEAFRVQALDYLMKPVNREELAQALQRVRVPDPQQFEGSALGRQRRRHISARTHRGLQLVPVDDIAYFLADQKYVTVRYSDGEILVDETLKDLEEEFGDLFVRIHRNALVSLACLEGLELSPTGQQQVRLRGLDERLTVSRRHVAALRRVMHHL